MCVCACVCVGVCVCEVSSARDQVTVDELRTSISYICVAASGAIDSKVRYRDAKVLRIGARG